MGPNVSEPPSRPLGVGAFPVRPIELEALDRGVARIEHFEPDAPPIGFGEGNHPHAEADVSSQAVPPDSAYPAPRGGGSDSAEEMVESVLLPP